MAMGRPRGFDKDQALRKATEVFWRKGYDGASMADLTSAMGINPPSLYAAFGSKEGLFLAATADYVRGREVMFQEMMEAATPRDAALLVLRGTARLATDPAHPPGCLLIQGGVSCGSGEKIPRELACHRATLEAALRERFERDRDLGSFGAGEDVAALARYVSTVCQGIGLQAASGMARADLETIAEQAVAGFPGPGNA